MDLFSVTTLAPYLWPVPSVTFYIPSRPWTSWGTLVYQFSEKKEFKKALIGSICPFLWCKFSSQQEPGCLDALLSLPPPSWPLVV